MDQAPIIEMFSSIQGEGPYVGYRQLFIRFAECNLSCDYCDTPTEAINTAKIEQTPGLQDFELISNPVDKDTLTYYVKQAFSRLPGHHSISLTGGEPLLHADFLKPWMQEIFTKFKFPFYLETNGTLPEELRKIVKLVNFTSMDIKLPSVAKLERPYWQEHQEFLRILAENKSCGCKTNYFVKVVVNENTTDEELYNVVWCITSSESAAEVILQPESNNPPEPLRLLKMQEKLITHLGKVRVIPQTHKMLHII